jgi:hypothetical protein
MIGGGYKDLPHRAADRSIHWLGQWVTSCVGINQLAYHLLIGRVVLLSGLFEEGDARLTVYLIFFFIKSLSLSPVSRSKDANPMFSVREAHGQDPVTNTAEAIKPFFLLTVLQIFRDDSLGISECMLGCLKRYTVLILVLPVFVVVPLKMNHVLL